MGHAGIAVEGRAARCAGIRQQAPNVGVTTLNGRAGDSALPATGRVCYGAPMRPRRGRACGAPTPTPVVHRRLRGLAGLVLLACALCCWPLGPAAARDGTVAWRTVESPHFELHYPVGLEAVAFRALRLCEEAHRVLTPLYGHVPDRKVQVNITDYGDGANGSATALPYPRINLFAAPPTLDGNLSDFDDWLRLLIFHEFTHILQLDHVTGLPSALNHVFGKTAAPNQNLPSFNLEGGAMWAESLTSGRGRVRSAFFRGTLRSQALAGRLYGPSQVVHAPQDWPGANVWYMYGGHFHQWLATHRDPHAAARYHEAFSDELIPYGLNRAFTEATGQPLTALYRAWIADLTLTAEVEASRLRAQGLTPVSVVAPAPFNHRNPRFGPDGSLWSIDFSGRQVGAIYAREPLESQAELKFAPSTLAFETESTNRFDRCADGTLLYEQNDPFRGVYDFNDLHQATPYGPRQRVTRGARLREPACGPDARFAAAVQLVAGRTRLVEVDLGTGALKVLHDPGGLDLLSHPVVSRDGRTVVAVRASQRYGRDLVAVDRATGAVRPLTADHALELHPRFSPDGRWLVYASDRDGVFNLYARPWPEDGPPRRITRVLTGATDPEVSPDGRWVVFGLLSADGQDLAGAPFDPESAPTEDALPMEVPQASRPGADATAPPSQPYRPQDTLWPVAWSPAFSYTDAAQTGSQVGLELTAFDAAGQHVINAAVTGQPEEEAVSANLTYSLSRFTPLFQFDLAHSTQTRLGGALWGSARNDYRERVSSASVLASLPFSRAGRGASASLRYGISYLRPAENPTPVHDPLDEAPRVPEPLRTASLSLSVRFGDTDAYPYALSIDEGRAFGMTIRVRHSALGGELDTAEMLFDYTEYVPLWGRSVLALRATGAFGRGDSGGRFFYGLGAPPLRNVLLDALDEIAFGSTFLRGYSSGTVGGDRYVLTSAELRMPLLDVFDGPSTVPVFLRRAMVSVFTDWAQASNDPLEFSPGAFKRSVGAELLGEATLGWRLPLGARMGYAYGFDEGGDHQIYVFVGPWY